MKISHVYFAQWKNLQKSAKDFIVNEFKRKSMAGVRNLLETYFIPVATRETKGYDSLRILYLFDNGDKVIECKLNPYKERISRLFVASL